MNIANVYVTQDRDRYFDGLGIIYINNTDFNNNALV